MHDDNWKILVAKTAAELIQPLVNLEDNNETINLVFPFWQEFIAVHAQLSPENLNCWEACTSGDDQALLIASIRPQFRLDLFWAEAIQMAIKLRVATNVKEECP